MGNILTNQKKRVITQCIEHQQDSMNGKLGSSGATEHTKECHGQFDWLYLKTVRITPYMYQRKIHEALEINKLKAMKKTKPSQL